MKLTNANHVHITKLIDEIDKSEKVDTKNTLNEEELLKKKMEILLPVAARWVPGRQLQYYWHSDTHGTQVLLALRLPWHSSSTGTQTPMALK